MRRDDSSLALSLDLPLARATSSRVCRLRLHGLIVASRRRVELLRRGPHKRCQTSSFGPRLCGPLVGVFRPNADGRAPGRRRNAGRTCFADGIGKVWTEVGAETVLLESSTGLSPADVGELARCSLGQPASARAGAARVRGCGGAGGGEGGSEGGSKEGGEEGGK